MIKLTNYSIILLLAHSCVPREQPQRTLFLPRRISGVLGDRVQLGNKHRMLQGGHKTPAASKGQRQYKLANGLFKLGEVKNTSVS